MKQYADDTTIFLDGSYYSLYATVEAFKSFERASGLKINLVETNIFPLGSFVHEKPCYVNNFKFRWTLRPVRAFGIIFDYSRDCLLRLNFLRKLFRLKSLLNIWSQRPLVKL